MFLSDISKMDITPSVEYRLQGHPAPYDSGMEQELCKTILDMAK